MTTLTINIPTLKIKYTCLAYRRIYCSGILSQLEVNFINHLKIISQKHPYFPFDNLLKTLLHYLCIETSQVIMIISWLFCLYRVTLYIWQSMLHATYHTHKKICIYETRVTAHWRQRILLTGLPVLGKLLSLSTSFACIYLKKRIRNLLSQYLSSSEVKKGEYCIEYHHVSIVNSMVSQKPFYSAYLASRLF